MKQLRNILLLFTTILLAACNEEVEPRRPLEFCVKAGWISGQGNGPDTRALSATDILASGQSDITIAPNDYPKVITITPKEGDPFTLNASSPQACSTHSGYYMYTPSKEYRGDGGEISGLPFLATATIDDGDELECTVTSSNIVDTHMQFHLLHKKALLRFAFKLDARYNNIRHIKITHISLNGNDITLADKVLTTSDQFIAYAYIDPAVVTTSLINNIRCTYNIYDKDADTSLLNKSESELTQDEKDILAQHLTRPGIVASNQFSLDHMTDAQSAPITQIKAGYYYDLHVTLNPDYLYVLSEHDNKHITIN